MEALEILARAEMEQDIFILYRLNWGLDGHPRLHRLLKEMYDFRRQPAESAPVVEICFRDDARFYIVPERIALAAFRNVRQERERGSGGILSPGEIPG